MPHTFHPQKTLDKIVELVKTKFADEGSGHDWWHIYRVWVMAKKLAIMEAKRATQPLNQFVVEAGALLHDIADFKFHNGDETVGPAEARRILTELKVDEQTINHVCDVVAHVSFKGANVANSMKTLEGHIVQDADRLDALGAIGIARTFAYGGHSGRLLYHPEIKPEMHGSFAAYKTSQSPSLNHFYEKLFLLKDRLNTASAKKIAEHRHQVMEEFVAEFLAEWEGEC